MAELGPLPLWGPLPSTLIPFLLLLSLPAPSPTLIQLTGTKNAPPADIWNFLSQPSSVWAQPHFSWADASVPLWLCHVATAWCTFQNGHEVWRLPSAPGAPGLG